jgi:hypothetical protein
MSVKPVEAQSVLHHPAHDVRSHPSKPDHSESHPISSYQSPHPCVSLLRIGENTPGQSLRLLHFSGLLISQPQSGGADVLFQMLE